MASLKTVVCLKKLAGVELKSIALLSVNVIYFVCNVKKVYAFDFYGL